MVRIQCAAVACGCRITGVLPCTEQRRGSERKTSVRRPTAEYEAYSFHESNFEVCMDSGSAHFGPNAFRSRDGSLWSSRECVLWNPARSVLAPVHNPKLACTAGDFLDSDFMAGDRALHCTSCFRL